MILLKYLDFISNNKNAIINNWVNDKQIEELFYKYDVNINKFIEKYAPIMLDFYIHIIVNESKNSANENIDILLNYFKTKSIKSFELFDIFKSFKNILINQLDTKNLEIEKEINQIFELNFSDLLKRYVLDESNIENKLNHFSHIINEHVIMSSTDTKGIITQVSDAFCKISGYEKSELIGKPHGIIKHPDMDPLVYEELWETIKLGNAWQGEVKNLKNSGGFYWVDVKIKPSFDKNKNIIGYDSLYEDITSKKMFEHQQGVLIQQSKSSAMGEMISMIAHQWRQPLQAISILVQKIPITKMIEGKITDELVEGVLKDVNVQLDYMSRTIDDFRDFFKPNKEKNKIKVNLVVNEVLDFLSYMISIDSIKVNIDAIEDCVIEIYINELKQVLINIIKNARDEMIEKNLQERIINIKFYVNETSVVLEIEDNAGGIPSNVIKKVFEPYFSTKTNKNGTGLGLYMSRTIIEQHCGGKISVSNSDIGAVFRIELPLS